MTLPFRPAESDQAEARPEAISGQWVKLPGAPGPAECGRSYFRKIGAAWHRFLPRGPVDPRDLGAIGDGHHDDTAPITDAIALGNDIVLAPGTYAVKRVHVTRSTRIAARHGATLVPFDPDDASIGGVLLHIEADDCVVDGLAFRAPVASQIAETQGPWALLFAEKRQEGFGPELMADEEMVRFHRIRRLRVANCRFEGGHHGLWATAVDDGEFENLSFHDTQRYGIALMSGLRRSFLRGIRVDGTLNGEGIKIGYWKADVLAGDIVLTDFIVRNCGRLAVKPDVKEGIDLFMGAIRNLVVSNGIISGCSGGGIEIKTRQTDIVPDIYQNVLVSNLVIDNACEQKGIALLWASVTKPAESTLEAAGRVTLSNIRIRYSFDDMTVARGSITAAVTIMAWNRVTCRSVDIEGAGIGFNLSVGQNDKTNRTSDLMIDSCVIRDSQHGLSAPSGELHGLTIRNSDFQTRDRTIVLCGATVRGMRLTGSRFVQNAAASDVVNRYALDLRRVSASVIERCEIEGETFAIFAQKDAQPAPMPSEANAILDNRLVIAATGHGYVRLDDGTDWLVAGNRCSGKPSAPLVLAYDTSAATWTDGNAPAVPAWTMPAA
jgi:hypothetical protein